MLTPLILAELEALKREDMELHGGDFGSTGLVQGAGPFDDELSSLGMTLVELAEMASIPEDETREIEALIAGCPEKNCLSS